MAIGSSYVILLVRYFGHGGGEQYIRGHRIRKLNKCSVTLLMGCSSGKLNAAGEFDPSGTALNYIVAGWYFIIIFEKDVHILTLL
jgi:hypothetical protein